MMTVHRVAACLLLSAASITSWAAGQPEVPSAWEKFKSFTHAQKNDAVAEGKKLIAAADQRLAELSKKAKASTGELKAEHEKNMQELRAKKRDAEVQLKKLQAASSTAWDATKEGFSGAYKSLHDAATKAAAAAK